MRIDALDRQIAEYSRAALESVPELDIEEAAIERIGAGPVLMLQERPARRQWSAWAVALAAAAVVLAVGGLAAILGIQPSRSPEVADTPSITTAGTPPPTTASIDEAVSPLPPSEPVIVDTPLGAMEWAAVDDPSIQTDVIAWDGGLAALDWSGRLVWSDDGRSWHVLASDLPAREAVGIAVHRGSVYVVGAKTVMPEGYILTHPSAWRSTDLATWSEVPVDLLATGERLSTRPSGAGPEWSGVIGSEAGVIIRGAHGYVWALEDDRFVLGSTRLSTSDWPDWPIWAVGGGFVTGHMTDGYVFSVDGLRWDPIDAGAADGTFIVAVGRGEQGYLAIVYGSPWPSAAEFSSALRPMLLRSGDGIAWEAVEGGGLPADLLDGGSVVALGRGWLVTGDGGWGGPYRAWISPDGVSWEELPESLMRYWCGFPRSVDGRTVSVWACPARDGSGMWWAGRWTGRLLGG